MGFGGSRQKTQFGPWAEGGDGPDEGAGDTEGNWAAQRQPQVVSRATELQGSIVTQRVPRTLPGVQSERGPHQEAQRCSLWTGRSRREKPPRRGENQ